MKWSMLKLAAYAEGLFLRLWLPLALVWHRAAYRAYASVYALHGLPSAGRRLSLQLSYHARMGRCCKDELARLRGRP